MKKILVVDDDKSLQALIRAAFSDDACQVLSSLDPIQGLSMARKENPDLIILDIMMPAGGGLEFYQRIRNLTGLSRIPPILIYSGKPKAEILKSLPTANPEMILSKPITTAQIRNVVSTIIPLNG